MALGEVPHSSPKQEHRNTYAQPVSICAGFARDCVGEVGIGRASHHVDRSVAWEEPKLLVFVGRKINTGNLIRHFAIACALIFVIVAVLLEPECYNSYIYGVGWCWPSCWPQRCRVIYPHLHFVVLLV